MNALVRNCFLHHAHEREGGREIYPSFRIGTKRDNSPTHLPCQRPGLRFIASTPYSRSPIIQIDWEFIRDGPHVAFLLGQEIIHEPAILNQGPFDAVRLGFQDLPERFTGGTVEAGAGRMSFDVAAVFGGHEPFAGLGGDACREEGFVDGDVAFVVEVEEREEGGGVGFVED